MRKKLNVLVLMCLFLGIGLFSALPSMAQCNWTVVAGEGGTVNPVGMQEVRYGANGNYFYLTTDQSFTCNNDAFGGDDPAPGVAKSCYICVPAELNPPTAPSNLKAISVSTSQVNLTWNDNSNNEDGFVIERREAGGEWAEIADLEANVVNFSDTEVAAFTRYNYRVKAYNQDGPSAFTAAANTNTPPGEDCDWETVPGGENVWVKVEEPTYVRFGASGMYNYMFVEDSIRCHYDPFGYDPAPGIAKACAICAEKPLIPVEGVSLDSTALSLLVNGTHQLNATVAPTNATEKGLVWSSSDATIADVDQNGMVTAKAVGQADITVKTVDGDFEDVCKVTVEFVNQIQSLNLSGVVVYSPAYRQFVVTAPVTFKSVRVISILGEELLIQHGKTNSSTIDLSGFSSGVYLFVIDGSDNTVTKKIMLQ